VAGEDVEEDGEEEVTLLLEPVENCAWETEDVDAGLILFIELRISLMLGSEEDIDLLFLGATEGAVWTGGMDESSLALN
jgi:hypothetical protein